MYEPFNVSGIVTRLRLDLEHLFLANNHLLYIGKAWPTAEWLALQVGNRLSCLKKSLFFQYNLELVRHFLLRVEEGKQSPYDCGWCH